MSSYTLGLVKDTSTIGELRYDLGGKYGYEEGNYIAFRRNGNPVHKAELTKRFGVDIDSGILSASVNSALFDNNNTNREVVVATQYSHARVHIGQSVGGVGISLWGAPTGIRTNQSYYTLSDYYID